MKITNKEGEITKLVNQGELIDTYFVGEDEILSSTQGDIQRSNDKRKTMILNGISFQSMPHKYKDRTYINLNGKWNKEHIEYITQNNLYVNDGGNVSLNRNYLNLGVDNKIALGVYQTMLVHWSNLTNLTFI
jgi:hypothetical protein